MKNLYFKDEDSEFAYPIETLCGFFLRIFIKKLLKNKYSFLNSKKAHYTHYIHYNFKNQLLTLTTNVVKCSQM